MNGTIPYNTTGIYLQGNLKNFIPTSFEHYLRQKYQSDDKRINPNLVWLPRWDIGCISTGLLKYLPRRRHIDFDVESVYYKSGLFKLGALHLVFIPLCMILFYLGSCRKFCITPRMQRERMLVPETRLCSCILGTALCLVFVLQIHLHIATQDKIATSIKINIETLSSVRVFLMRTKRVLDDIKLHLHWTTNSYAYYREKQDIESRYYKHIKPISRSGDELHAKPIGNYSIVTPLMKAIAKLELWMYLFYTILWGTGLFCIYLLGTLQLTKLSTIFGMFCCCVGATTLMIVAVAIVDLNRNPAPAVHLLTLINNKDHYMEKQGLINEYTRVCKEWYEQFSKKRDEYNMTFVLQEGKLIKDFKRQDYYYTNTKQRQTELTNKFIDIRTTKVPLLYDVIIDCNPPPFEYIPPPLLQHIKFEDVPDWRTVGIGAICADDKLLQIIITQILILDMAAALCVLILFFGVLLIRSNNCNFLGLSYGYCPASINENSTCWIVRRKTLKEHFTISQPIPVIDCEDCSCEPKSKKKNRKPRKNKKYSKNKNLKELRTSIEKTNTENTKLRKSYLKKGKNSRKKTKKDKESYEELESSSGNIDMTQTINLKKSQQKNKTDKDITNKFIEQEKAKVKKQLKACKEKEKKLKERSKKDRRKLKKLEQSISRKKTIEEKTKQKKQTKTSKKLKGKLQDKTPKEKTKKEKSKKQSHSSKTAKNKSKKTKSSLQSIDTQTLPSTSKKSLTEEENILCEELERLPCRGSEKCPGSKELKRSKIVKGSKCLKPLCKPCSTQYPRTPPGSSSCPGLNICPGTNSVSVRLPCKGSEMCPGSKQSKCFKKVTGSKSLKPLCKPCSTQFPRTPPGSLSCPGKNICPGTNSVSLRLPCKGSEICPGSREPKYSKNINGSKNLKPICKPCSTQFPRIPSGSQSCPGSKACLGSNSVSLPIIDSSLKLKGLNRSKNKSKKPKRAKRSKFLKYLCKPSSTQISKLSSESLCCPNEFLTSKEPTKSKLSQIPKKTKKSKKSKEPKKTKEPKNSKEAKTSKVLPKSKELRLTCKDSETFQVPKQILKTKKSTLPYKSYDVCLDLEKVHTSKEPRLQSKSSEVCLATDDLQISRESSQLSKKANISKVNCSEVCLDTKELQRRLECKSSNVSHQISTKPQISKKVKKSKESKKSKKPKLPCKDSAICPGSKELQSSKESKKAKKSRKAGEKNRANKEKVKSSCPIICKNKSEKSCGLRITDENVIDKHAERLSCRASEICPGSKQFQTSKKAKNAKKSKAINKSKKAKRSDLAKRSKELKKSKKAKGSKTITPLCKPCSTQFPRTPAGGQTCPGSKLCPGSKSVRKSRRLEEGKTGCDKALCELKKKNSGKT